MSAVPELVSSFRRPLTRGATLFSDELLLFVGELLVCRFRRPRTRGAAPLPWGTARFTILEGIFPGELLVFLGNCSFSYFRRHFPGEPLFFLKESARFLLSASSCPGSCSSPWGAAHLRIFAGIFAEEPLLFPGSCSFLNFDGIFLGKPLFFPRGAAPLPQRAARFVIFGGIFLGELLVSLFSAAPSLGSCSFYYSRRRLL
jgi:hypothetical protein